MVKEVAYVDGWYASIIYGTSELDRDWFICSGSATYRWMTHLPSSSDSYRETSAEPSVDPAGTSPSIARFTTRAVPPLHESTTAALSTPAHATWMMLTMTSASFV